MSKNNVNNKSTENSGNEEKKAVENNQNKISLSGDNGTLEDEDFRDLDDDPQPIEYIPPFPLEKVAIGAVAMIIVVLVAIIFIKNISNNKINFSVSDGQGDQVTEATTEGAVYSITDDTAKIAMSVDKDYSDIVIKNYNSVTCWGDEYMSGTLTNNFSIPTYIARRISGKYTVFNAGCYNENINGVAERQGGVYIEVMPVVIPSDPVEVPVEIKNMYGESCNIHTSEDRNGGLNPVSINGVEGTLTSTGHGYTFKRTAKGDELRIVHPMRVKTKGSIDRNNDIQVIFVGKKQNYDVDRLVEIYKSMVNYINPMVKPYVIVGIVEGTAEEQKEFEDKMTGEFGRHFINLREYLSTYAMSEIGFTPTAEDNDLISRGCVPKSLMDSDGWFKAETNEVIAGIIYERLEELNIL